MTEWRLHLGVHKTATTHLQAAIAALEPELASTDVQVFPVELLRPATRWVFRMDKWRNRVRFWRRGGLDVALRPHLCGKQVVVLSEENWIGDAGELCVVPPYSQLQFRLRPLHELATAEPVHLFVAVRNPVDFVPAVYAQALRYNSDLPSPRELKRLWLARPQVWSQFIGTIADEVPSASLTVWRYEDYRTNVKAIIERVVGRPIAAVPAIDDPAATVRPSAEAVAKMRTLRFHSQKRRRACVEAILRENPVTPETAFRMFDAHEEKRLSDAYESDLKEIERKLPGVLMRFPSSLREHDPRRQH